MCINSFCLKKVFDAHLRCARAYTFIQGGGISLSVDKAAHTYLVDRVSSGQAGGGQGAQHVRGVIKTHVMAPLAGNCGRASGVW